jgi:lipopolysaccharide transport system ATP-binding protein
MGLSERETRDRLPDILAFADIGEHIDQPIKQYSSGMVVRLGFAIATIVRPEVLITDEVLAVGDESFQRKCVRWMEDFLGGGGTLLLCSHGMYHIEKLCQKAVWLHEGRVRSYGVAKEITREYLAWHDARGRPSAERAAVAPRAAGEYAVRSLTVNDIVGEEVAVPAGGLLVVQGTLFSPDDRPPGVAIGIARADGSPVYGLSSDTEGYALQRLRRNEYGFRIEFYELALLPGRYEVRAHAMDPESYRVFNEMVQPLVVEGSSRAVGVCRLAHRWVTETETAG